MNAELVDKLTPTEKRIMEALADGYPHRRRDLLPLIDEMAVPQNLKDHLSNIRKKLRPMGEDVICEYYNRGLSYRWIRLIGNGE